MYIVTVQDNNGDIQELKVFTNLESASTFEKRMLDTYRDDWTIGFFERDVEDDL